MLIVISVGTTRFDALIAAALKVDFLTFLLAKFQPRRLVIQHGNSPLPAHLARFCAQEGAVEVRAFIPGAEMGLLLQEAEIVIAHGGAGTAFEVLRRDPLMRCNGSRDDARRLAPKTQTQTQTVAHGHSKQVPFLLVMCENEALQDGHQGEFIDALVETGCSVLRGSVCNLQAVFEDVDVGCDGKLYRQFPMKEILVASDTSAISVLPAPNTVILPQIITALLRQ
jgi:UDP-N-acetylglucosamine transferase subunit ALG13